MSGAAPEFRDDQHQFAAALCFLAYRHRIFFRDPKDPRGLAPPDNAPAGYAQGIAMAIKVLNDRDRARAQKHKGRLRPADVIPFTYPVAKETVSDDPKPTS